MRQNQKLRTKRDWNAIRLLFLTAVMFSLTVATCYIVCDSSLRSQFFLFIGRVITSTVLWSAVWFVAGVVVTSVWFLFFGDGIRHRSWRRGQEISVVFYALTLVWCICPFFSYWLDKWGLRFAPTAITCWSWSTFANVLLSAIATGIMILGIFRLLKLLQKKAYRRTMPNSIGGAI